MKITEWTTIKNYCALKGLNEKTIQWRVWNFLKNDRTHKRVKMNGSEEDIYTMKELELRVPQPGKIILVRDK